MPSVKEVLAPISLNIAEEKGWEPYDPAGNILEWSSDNAYEAFILIKESIFFTTTILEGSSFRKRSYMFSRR